MKGHTDLSQSKKLAEFLPLESADMFYRDNGIDAKLMWEHNAQKVKYPCWSLVALLGVLPRIDIEKEICSDDTYDYRVKAYIGDGYIGDWYDNAIDACYEMILKLHELKML